MKKLMLFSVVLLFVSLGSHAQKNVIKVDPLGLLFNTAQLSYERVIGEKSSLELSLNFNKVTGSLSTLSNDTEVNTLGFEGKYKFYLSSVQMAPKGWYVAPVANYSSTTLEESGKSGKVTEFGAGLLGGYQWILGGFSLDFNLGAIYKNVDKTGDITSIKLDGLLPKVGLGIGYAF